MSRPDPELQRARIQEEAEVLENLIKSPAWGTVRRILQSYIAVEQGRLLTLNEPAEIYRTQGRIIGIQMLMTIPEGQVVQFLQKRADEALDEKRKQGFMPPRKL